MRALSTARGTATMKLIELYQTDLFFRNIFHSILFIVALFVLRALTIRSINRSKGFPQDQKHRFVVQIKNYTFLLIFFCLIFIWASELRSLAFSIAAVAAAVVLALKELILCLSGSFLQASARPFNIGDRIEINGVRGDVIDQNLFVTRVLEVGPGTTTHQYTGRSVTIPNSMFLNNQIINETFSEDYVLHVFVVPIHFSKDWRKAEQHLIQAAQAECNQFVDKARLYMDRAARKRNLEPPSVEPRVTLSMKDSSHMDLTVRVTIPARNRGKIEQAILRRFLDAWSFNTPDNSPK